MNIIKSKYRVECIVCHKDVLCDTEEELKSFVIDHVDNTPPLVDTIKHERFNVYVGVS
jgi:SUMO ligase MMS21 Smc5/6 complex component